MTPKTALIGHTGFVGGNLSSQFTFDALYNSKNIGDIRNQEFDLLVCSGVSAVKWWANQNPVEDRDAIDALLADLAFVRAKKVFLLSTVDVYPVNHGVDETFDCQSLPNHPYGTNRLYFENAMRARFGDVRTVRISGVFGRGLKKNVIYDLLHDNCLEAINRESSFQYYNVSNLSRDLQRLDQTGISLINFVNEPIRTGDIIDRFFPGKRVGDRAASPAQYDLHTRHSEAMGSSGNYLARAEEVMDDLGHFIRGFGGAPAR